MRNGRFQTILLCGCHFCRCREKKRSIASFTESVVLSEVHAASFNYCLTEQVSRLNYWGAITSSKENPNTANKHAKPRLEQQIYEQRKGNTNLQPA